MNIVNTQKTNQKTQQDEIKFGLIQFKIVICQHTTSTHII